MLIKNMYLGKKLAWLLAVATASVTPGAGAHFGPVPVSLKNIPLPEVPGLVDGPDPIVTNVETALVLGKALFWDTQVGSDGMACASCHFHAGADRRIKNQLAPSGKHALTDPDHFDLAQDGTARGPNYSLKRSDFPFFQTDDPLSTTGNTIYNSDDVVSSSGSFGGDYQQVRWFGPDDDVCQRNVDPVFHTGAVGTRRVEPRNAPTVINAVFNFRNLWDGAANNIFNGSSPWGDRDPDAGVWVKTGDAAVEKQRLRLINSSLASQAVSPPVSSIEMGCSNRTFADLGRKLMWRRPLANQEVHWNDSVLGPYANSTADTPRTGLNTFYVMLVRESFNPKYWSYFKRGEFGAPADNPPMKALPYDQYEANFSMFFALALQLYQSTLISDDSPFDRSARDENQLPIDLSQQELNGLQNFRVAHCVLCHVGPTLSSAAIITNAMLVEENPLAFGNETFSVSTTRNVVNRMSVTGGFTIIDTGFASNGVTPEEADPGLGGTDPFGNPLSFADQYLQFLAGNPDGVIDPYVSDTRACDFELSIAREASDQEKVFFTPADGIIPQPQGTENCFSPLGAFLPTPEAAAAELASADNTRMLSAARGSFKIPALRNIDLTGPYMHNGGMATLEEVLESYIRGGNFNPDAKQFGTVFPQPLLRLVPSAREEIIAFLKTLTDERVLYERAPFDHPAIKVPHGHTGDHVTVAGGNRLHPDLGEDEFLFIPAVGASGRSTPLKPFVDHLPAH